MILKQGCFAKLFTRAKIRCVKQINEVRKDKKLKKNRTKEELTDENRKKRRKKGSALGAYAKIKGGKLFSPNIDLEVIEASSKMFDKNDNVDGEEGTKKMAAAKPPPSIDDDDDRTVTSVSTTPILSVLSNPMSDSSSSDDELDELPNFSSEDDEVKKLKVSK